MPFPLLLLVNNVRCDVAVWGGGGSRITRGVREESRLRPEGSLESEESLKNDGWLLIEGD